MTEEQKSLVLDNYALACKVAHSYSNIRIELEDRIQICLIALCRAAETYDRERGNSFASYAWGCMLNEVNMNIRRDKKHPPDAFQISLNSEVCTELNNGRDLSIHDIIPDKCDVEKEVIDSITIHECIVAMDSILSDKEAYIVKHKYLLGKKQETIATELNISQSYVSRVERKALHKMRSYMEEGVV